MIPTLSPYIIPMFLEEFSKKYPKVELTISEFTTDEIVEKLHDDELDAGLLVTPLYEDQIMERSLFFEPFYVFVSEGHELASRKIIKDNELDINSVWLLTEGHCFRNQVIKVCSMKERKPVLENVHFESGNLETLKNLNQKGKWLYTSALSCHTQTSHKVKKTKHLKKFTKPTPTREVSLVHSRSFLKADIIEALQNEIIESIPPELQSLKKGNTEVIDI